jgi:hypothetical protein
MNRTMTMMITMMISSSFATQKWLERYGSDGKLVEKSVCHRIE